MSFQLEFGVTARLGWTDIRESSHPRRNPTSRAAGDQSISAADAIRRFAQLLRDVRQGRSYVVTVHGEPVARIIPVTAAAAARQGARTSLFRRLEAQPVSEIGRWLRDGLYDAP